MDFTPEIWSNSSEILPKSLIAAAVEFGFVSLLRIAPREDALDTAPAVAAYRFRGFVLDLARGALLTRSGEEIPLRRKTYRLLQLLVENAGQLLDRDTIYQAIWADLAVSDDSITQCIHEIRRGLGDKSQRIVRTVPGRGYQMAAEVTTVNRQCRSHHRYYRPASRRARQRAAPLSCGAAVRQSGR